MKTPLKKLRAWWSHRQTLDGRMAGAAPAAVLAEAGRARSVAGVGPYLTLFARGLSLDSPKSRVPRIAALRQGGK
ncbi:MAG TPA: hypothetical protein VGS58_04810 [Candidatus Sulfopaludibacter sp.]|nr:hypothetical protein [Candidatus Sulfopaludibacter sp.]